MTKFICFNTFNVGNYFCYVCKAEELRTKQVYWNSAYTLNIYSYTFE